MKRNLVMLSLAAVLLGLSSFARADLNSFLNNVNVEARTDLKNFTIKLSAQFGIPETEVQLIIKSVSKPSDAFMILQIGQMANVDHRTVLQKYKSSKSKGWGNLASKLGIKPGSPEFHALKRGDFSFSGKRSEGRMERDDGGPGREHGKSKGKGRGKD